MLVANLPARTGRACRVDVWIGHVDCINMLTAGAVKLVQSSWVQSSWSVTLMQSTSGGGVPIAGL
jgi:hypothetical protein